MQTSRFKSAREQLGLQVPDELPGREEEVEKLFSRLSECTSSDTSITMYIAGEPGTGKTATVKHVLSKLISHQEERNASNLNICFVNAMSLPSPKDIYLQVWKVVGSTKKVAKKDVPKRVRDYFAKATARRKFTIIVIDELDFANTKDQEVIYEFMDWPQKGGSKMAVIGISNTVNFPEQLKEKIANRMQSTERMIFKTYTTNQIEKILLKRLEGTDLFDEKAVKIVAHRIASASGDIRRGLDICRRAAEMKEEKIKIDDNEEEQQQESSDQTSEEPVTRVISRKNFKRKRRVTTVLSQKSQQRLETEKITLEDVNKAFEELAQTELYPITYLPCYHKLFLWCSRLESQDQDGELKSENIISRVQTLIRKNSQHTAEVTIFEMLPVLDSLIEMGYFTIKSDKERYPIIELLIANDDISRALDTDEEVRRLTAL